MCANRLAHQTGRRTTNVRERNGNGKGRRQYGTGSVWQDDRGVWRGAVRLANGRRRTVTGTSERDARRKVDALRAEIESAAEDADAVRERWTLGDWLSHWIEDVAEDRAPNTVENRRWAQRHLEPLAQVKLTDLTTPMVDRFLKAKAAGTCKSESTLGRLRNVLAMALDAAIVYDLVDRNVARRASIPRQATASREGRALTPAEVAALLRVAREHRHEVIVVLGLYLGLRPGEICGLLWRHVDFDAGTVTIVQARRRNPGTGIEMTNAKARSERTLVAPEPVMDALRRHWQRQSRNHAVTPLRPPDDDLVVTSKSGRPLDARDHWAAVLRMGADAGIGRVIPYDLRHTCATAMVEAGVPLSNAADQLGHRNEAMLANTYRHRRRAPVAASSVLVEAYGAEPPAGPSRAVR
jgi:integrase